MSGRLALALSSLLMAATLPAVAAEADAGRRKAGSCAACHGENGIATLPNAPHLAGQPADYLAEQLRLYRAGRRANEVMAVAAKALTDADIADLAAWYASIAIEAKLPK